MPFFTYLTNRISPKSSISYQKNKTLNYFEYILSVKKYINIDFIVDCLHISKKLKTVY